MNPKELINEAKSRLPIQLPFQDDMLPPWATNQISFVRNVWFHKDEIWINYERHHGSGTKKR